MATAHPAPRTPPHRFVEEAQDRFRRLDAVEAVDTIHDSWCESNGVDEVLKRHDELRVDVRDPVDEAFQEALADVQDDQVTVKRDGVYVVDGEGRDTEVSYQSEQYDSTITRYRLIPE